MSENPAIDDLEISLETPISNSNKTNPFADISSALETILSEDNFDQKTNINSDNEIGLIGLDVVQAYFTRHFKKEFAALTAIKDSKQTHVVSVGGYRSNQIFEVFKSLQTNIISGDVPLRNRFLGK